MFNNSREGPLDIKDLGTHYGALYKPKDTFSSYSPSFQNLKTQNHLSSQFPHLDMMHSQMADTSDPQMLSGHSQGLFSILSPKQQMISKSFDQGIHQVKNQLSNLKDIQIKQRQKLDLFLKTLNFDIIDNQNKIKPKGFDDSPNFIVSPQQHTQDPQFPKNETLKSTDVRMSPLKQSSPMKESFSPQRQYRKNKHQYLSHKTDQLFKEYNRYKRLYADRFNKRLQFLQFKCHTPQAQDTLAKPWKPSFFSPDHSGQNHELQPPSPNQPMKRPLDFKLNLEQFSEQGKKVDENLPFYKYPLPLDTDHQIDQKDMQSQKAKFQDIGLSKYNFSDQSILQPVELSPRVLDKGQQSIIEEEKYDTIFQKFDQLQQQSQQNYQNLRYQIQESFRHSNFNPQKSQQQDQSKNDIQKSESFLTKEIKSDNSKLSIQIPNSEQFSKMQNLNTPEKRFSEVIIKQSKDLSHDSNQFSFKRNTNDPLQVSEKKESQETEKSRVSKNLWSQSPYIKESDSLNFEKKQTIQSPVFNPKQDRFESDSIQQENQKQPSIDGKKIETSKQENQEENRNKVKQIIQNIKKQKHYKNIIMNDDQVKNYEIYLSKVIQESNRKVTYISSIQDESQNMTQTVTKQKTNQNSETQIQKQHLLRLLQQNFERFNIIPDDRNSFKQDKFKSQLSQIEEDQLMDEISSTKEQHERMMLFRNSMISLNDMKINQSLFQYRGKESPFGKKQSLN